MSEKPKILPVPQFLLTPTAKVHKPLAKLQRKNYTVTFSQIPATPTHPTPEIEAEVKLHPGVKVSEAVMQKIVQNELDWFIEGLKKDEKMRKRLDDAKRIDEKNWKEHERILKDK